LLFLKHLVYARAYLELCFFCWSVKARMDGTVLERLCIVMQCSFATRSYILNHHRHYTFLVRFLDYSRETFSNIDMQMLELPSSWSDNHSPRKYHCKNIIYLREKNREYHLWLRYRNMSETFTEFIWSFDWSSFVDILKMTSRSLHLMGYFIDQHLLRELISDIYSLFWWRMKKKNLKKMLKIKAFIITAADSLHALCYTAIHFTLKATIKKLQNLCSLFPCFWLSFFFSLSCLG